MEIGPKLPAAALLRGQAEPAKSGDPAKDAARNFEAEFLAQFVEEMMSTVKSGSFGGGHGEELWRSFLSRAFADEIAARDMTGLSGSVEGAIAAYRSGGGKGGA